MLRKNIRMKLVTTSIVQRKKAANTISMATLVGSQEQYYGVREWWQINEHVTLTIVFTEPEFEGEKESSIFVYTPSRNITEKVASKIIKNINKIEINTKTNGLVLIDLCRADFEVVLAEIEDIVNNQIDYPERGLSNVG